MKFEPQCTLVSYQSSNKQTFAAVVIHSRNIFLSFIIIKEERGSTANFWEIMTIMTIQCMLRHDAGGGRKTTLSFGVALSMIRSFVHTS